ncbi:MAG TPA: hypothetical protein VGQ57_03385, partial [Polyangiaceae bacterium]|nr:hypothetical protein [Polyangiaceae bacterium]
MLLASAVFWVGSAAAATIGILRSRSDAPALDEARFRLQGELSAIGLEVAMLARPPASVTDSAEGRAWLERTATERDIDAFIDVIGERDPVAVDVWIRERDPVALRVTRVTLEPNAGDRAATLAIRAIEVLRSSFLARELALASSPRDMKAAPRRTEAPQAPPPTNAPLRVEAGATLLTGFDGVGPAFLPLVRLGWAVRPWLELEASAAAFGTRATIRAESGSADVAQSFVLLGLCLCSPAVRGVHPLVALSMGALRTGIEAHATPPNVAEDVTRWTALLDGALGARLGLPDHFYLTMAAHLQLSEPAVA